MASVSQFLTGPLERVDPSEGSTQVLVLTADPETAVALAEAVLRMTGPAGIELVPITTARRARRLMADRPVLATAGSPRDIRDLVQGSQLKLHAVKSVVLAWADEILSGDQDDVAALETVMNELPKDAARIVVTSRSEGRVNAFAERYLRRARREAEPELDEGAAPIAVQYVTVSSSSRGTALRRLLDDLDPPSAAIVVSEDKSEREVSAMLRMLGYHEGSAAVRVSRGEIEPATYAVIFYDAPATRGVLAKAAQATPVSLISMTDRRELAALKRIAGGDVRPFTLSAPGSAARDRETAMRRELSVVLDSGLASREVLALEPLLERYDGIEIAAAALRLLEKERALKLAKETDRPPARAETRSFERPPFAPRGDRPDRGDRPGKPAFGKPRDGGRGGPRDAGRRDKGPPRRDAGRSEGRPPRRDRP